MHFDTVDLVVADYLSIKILEFESLIFAGLNFPLATSPPTPPFTGMRLLARLKQRSAEKAVLQRLQLIEQADISIMDMAFHEEVVETVVEEGHTIFVGATAKFDENWQIQQLKPDRVEKFGYPPTPTLVRIF